METVQGGKGHRRVFSHGQINPELTAIPTHMKSSNRWTDGVDDGVDDGVEDGVDDGVDDDNDIHALYEEEDIHWMMNMTMVTDLMVTDHIFQGGE